MFEYIWRERIRNEDIWDNVKVDEQKDSRWGWNGLCMWRGDAPMFSEEV